MENTDFKVDIKIIWILTFGYILLTIAGLLIKNQNWELGSQILLLSGFIAFFATWIIVFSDIYKANIFNKPFWIISMLILPALAIIIYLIRRNKITED